MVWETSEAEWGEPALGWGELEVGGRSWPDGYLARRSAADGNWLLVASPHTCGESECVGCDVRLVREEGKSTPVGHVEEGGVESVQMERPHPHHIKPCKHNPLIRFPLRPLLLQEGGAKFLRGWEESARTRLAGR